MSLTGRNLLSEMYHKDSIEKLSFMHLQNVVLTLGIRFLTNI